MPSPNEPGGPGGPNEPGGPRDPTRIALTDERRATLKHALGTLFAERFDEQLSDFRGDELVDFFLRQLGPAVYNQAIADARGFMLERLDDLDAEFFEPEA